MNKKQFLLLSLLLTSSFHNTVQAGVFSRTMKMMVVSSATVYGALVFSYATKNIQTPDGQKTAAQALHPYLMGFDQANHLVAAGVDYLTKAVNKMMPQSPKNNDDSKKLEADPENTK